MSTAAQTVDTVSRPVLRRVRAPEPSQPELGLPREASIVERYLPDPSLRYSVLSLGGTWFRSFVLVGAPFVVGLALLGLVLSDTFGDRHGPLGMTLLVLGACASLLPLYPLQILWRRGRATRFVSRALRVVELGLDRAIFQPGTTFRYELHIVTRRPIELRRVDLRLVFWETWLRRARVPWLGLTYFRKEKFGHDLSRQEAGGIVLSTRGAHAVIRGEIPVPKVRPTEHHRGKYKHLAYVNITTTLLVGNPRQVSDHRVDCPCLITFPWM